MAPENGDRAVFEVDSLRFSYGSREVLHDVSFAVERGEVCGLLGPNGSGKSTLFRCGLGFLKPRQGTVRANGLDVRKASPAVLAKQVAYIPQEHRQPFPFRVREVVQMGRTPHMNGFFRLSRRDLRKVDEAMERLGITDLADENCNRLSGGQRQLVMIARALAQDAPILLLDEPTSALDFNNQLVVWQTLREIASTGVAIVVCCHDPNHILWFCDRAVVLEQGRILFDGSAVQLGDGSCLQTLYGAGCTVSKTAGLNIVHPRL
jgi:ABC-type cobalamin/Fe3+-siderophores transport systems, ATPase components